MSTVFKPIPLAVDTLKPTVLAGTVCHILIVDDESSMCEFVADALRDSGYDVDMEVDTDVALEKLHTGHYDLLLTDFFMPKLTGGELILKMREAQINIPAIIMTGAMDALPKSMGSQAEVVLEKPFMIQELLEALKEVLQPTCPSGKFQLNFS